MRFVLIFAMLVSLLAGCLTISEPPSPDDDRVATTGEPAAAARGQTPGRDVPGEAAVDEPGAGAPVSVSRIQQRLVDAARDIVVSQSTAVGTTTFPYDCSGTILAVYARAGIYLADLFAHYPGNGVARLHGIAADAHVLHTRKLPAPGDVIFWDNTYDRNGDGLWNDPLTHAGMVVSVDGHGTIAFIHHNYRRGIVVATMNLLEPETYQESNGTMVNSPMRMASQRAANPDLWLSSHLFREFASMYMIDVSAASISDGAAVVSLR